MDAVLRATVISLFLVVLFRLAGKRTLVDHIIEGTPLILVQDGQPIEERMRKNRVEPADVLEQARISQAVERMDQIKYAVLETDGQISIIPKSPSA